MTVVSEEPRGEELLELYQQMAVIRATEKAAYDLFVAGLVKGTTHLASGQEAVAVGASAALEPDDYVFATYRGHHHAIARGASPEGCLAELMSRATGLCVARAAPCTDRGRHKPLVSHRRRTFRRLGGPPGRPGGATSQVAVAFFGDGATNIAPSTRPSTLPRCGGSPSSSCARTTSTWSTPRSRR